MKRTVVVGLALGVVIAGATPVIAGERYCGLGTQRTLATKTTFVLSSHGARLMQSTPTISMRWSRPSYFWCQP